MYSSNGLGITLTSTAGGFGGKTGLYTVLVNKKDGIKSVQKANTLCASYYKGIMRNQNQTAVLENNNYCRIRKLTPLECFRLQGFSDELFHRAKGCGMSDSQLYKQAGNAITTNIAYEIGKKLKVLEENEVNNEI